MTDTDIVAERPVPTLPATAPLQTPVLRRLGQSDLKVYPVAIGGNVFGWTADATATDAVLDRYTGLGGNFIDTADSYAGGRSEIMIGNWLRRRGRRDDLVIATKIGKSADHPGLSSRAVVDAVHASLGRLRTDRIDLLYLHVDDEQVPFEETLMAVDQLIRSGAVRYFGASNHTGNRLIEARVACAMLGVAPMVALQNHYNLVHRGEYEKGLAHIARAQELGVMPRFALASGFLSGKYRSRNDLDGSARAAGIAPHLNKRGLRILAALDRIAAAHGVSCATIAIAWLLAKPLVVAPVTSATEPEQVDELMAAAQLRLTRQQVVELDRASD
ncbi:aryl-alcohol dehydrogenase-like predicted oxidoreductase [Diaminobutyricimonas aerilata]|uniref:Aryl-alcohol dehydrogenase-like predicted oxidoreductase n=1 Tax=Diaminobutyricimonas aerilata TaxID=1162967 RepID=A0A2M9CKV4_9MICO|nr:aldo/keto reductase [Diaminobutyricimonas aerilata]PJJ72536.1 aryl-alcohol dehydrogenase-like predicted oxidoreductase [Diaminobutyricimonas aerilata]